MPVSSNDNREEETKDVGVESENSSVKVSMPRSESRQALWKCGLRYPACRFHCSHLLHVRTAPAPHTANTQIIWYEEANEVTLDFMVTGN